MLPLRRRSFRPNRRPAHTCVPVRAVRPGLEQPLSRAHRRLRRRIQPQFARLAAHRLDGGNGPAADVDDWIRGHGGEGSQQRAHSLRATPSMLRTLRSRDAACGPRSHSLLARGRVSGHRRQAAAACARDLGEKPQASARPRTQDGWWMAGWCRARGPRAMPPSVRDRRTDKLQAPIGGHAGRGRPSVSVPTGWLATLLDPHAARVVPAQRP